MPTGVFLLFVFTRGDVLLLASQLARPLSLVTWHYKYNLVLKTRLSQESCIQLIDVKSLSSKQIAHAQKMPLAQQILTTISQFQLFRFRFPLQFSVSAFSFCFPFPPFPLAPFLFHILSSILTTKLLIFNSKF